MILLTHLKERGNKGVNQCQRKENHTSTGEESCSGSRTSKIQPGGQLYQSQTPALFQMGLRGLSDSFSKIYRPDITTLVDWA